MGWRRVCDEDEIAGCTDEAACDYSAAATDDDGSCTRLTFMESTTWIVMVSA